MNNSENLNLFFKILSIDFLRYFIPVCSAFLIFWIFLKKKLAHRFIQKKFPKSKMFFFEFKYSMSTVFIFSFVGLCVFWLNNLGFLHVYDEISLYGRPYAIMSLFLAIIFHDFYFYWTHRLMHHPKIFKHVHLVHHKSTNPSPWAAYSFHPIEAFIQSLVLPILLLLLPMYNGMIFLFLIYMILRNVLGHLGFELFSRGFTKNRWLSWHTTSTHHNMHHKYFNCNYGLYFTWWDDIMNTTHKDYHNFYDGVLKRIKSSSLLKKRLFLVAFLITLTISGQSPEGKWITYNEDTGEELSIVAINYDTEKAVFLGRVDSIILQPYQGKTPKCSKCPGPKKNKSVIGMEILNDFKSYGDEWRDGKILDPASGKVYNSAITIKNDSTLLVSGYGGPFNLFSRTQKWIRIGKGRSIEGYWKTIDDTFNKEKSIIELKLDGIILKGYIRELYLLPNEGNYPVCVSCKGKLKNQPIVGMIIMNDFKKLENEWVGGEIMDPGNGNTYKAKFWMTGENQLVIRGYFGPFYRTQTWKRFNKIKEN